MPLSISIRHRLLWRVLISPARKPPHSSIAQVFTLPMPSETAPPSTPAHSSACDAPPTYACSSVRYSARLPARISPCGRCSMPAASDAHTAITHSGRVSPSSSSRWQTASAAPSYSALRPAPASAVSERFSASSHDAAPVRAPADSCASSTAAAMVIRLPGRTHSPLKSHSSAQTAICQQPIRLPEAKCTAKPIATPANAEGTQKP